MSLLRTAIAAFFLSVTTAAASGPVEKAQDALDPDCTPAKAAKGAAMKATVGIGNRCGVGETVRDLTGTDGKAKEIKKGNEGLKPKKSEN